MKVLQILPSLDVGGVERGVIDQVRAMKRLGEQSVVVSSGGELVAELERMGVPHYTLPVHKKSVFALGLVAKMEEIIRRERVDVVHARSRVPAWIAWLAARRTGTPFVTTCHGYYSTHALSRVMGWGKRVIVISRVVGRHMIDDFGVSPERIRLVHRGVDLSQFPFREIENVSGKRPFRILNVGRFSPIKGQVEFLKAVHLLRQEIQQIEVWLAGSEGKGKRKYTELIEQTIRQLGLESCVKLLGKRRDIPELLAQSDLLVLSTLVPEAFGRVVIEAGACGTPVVATRVGGVLDIIDEGRNGLFAAPGDAEDMCRAMARMLRHPEEARQMAARLRKKVEAEFTLDLMIQRVRDVYREAVQDKKILIFKLGAMGDLILGVPSFRMLRRRFPGAHLALVVDRKLAPLVSVSPYLDEIVPVDRKRLSSLPYLLKLAKKLRRESYEISVDLQNSKWTHLLALLAGIKERYGFRRGRLGFLLNRPHVDTKPAESPVKNQFRIISKLGVREIDEGLELWTEPASEERMNGLFGETGAPADGKWIGLAVGASEKWPTKRWPGGSFDALASKLLERRHRLVLLGSAEDAKGYAQGFSAPSGSLLNLIGKTSIPDLVSAIKRLDVLVTGDTAPLHVAGALGKRTVALFGPTDSRRHVQDRERTVVLERGLECQPCYSGVCRNPDKLACLKQIAVEDVLDAVEKQLQGEGVPL